MQVRDTPPYGLEVRWSAGGKNNGILLGRFLVITVKNCYLISAFAIAPKGGALAQHDFLSFGA